ncbi:M23 family metallopeptidase [Streptomyces sp. NPDC053755]|uniref:M23 family metallopeptidase n=1 Tax=Streptomyces sp. NPDC053755 TaxID=3155815 RepID=UPI003439D03E
MHLTTLLLALSLAWPVGPPPPEILRRWDPPAGPYAPGHRGLDLAAAPGTTVHATAPGVVTFAGPVGGRGVLTITLPATGTPPLRTTYEPVTPLVPVGTPVTPGRPVATLSAPATRAHCPRSCLHWGLLRGDTYLDPLRLLRPGPSRLLPVTGVP